METENVEQRLRDDDIKAMFARRAARSDPGDLYEEVRRTAIATRQHTAWRTRLGWPVQRSLVLGVVLTAMLAVAMTGLLLVGAGVIRLAREPEPVRVQPTGVATSFAVPFEYAVPHDSRLTPARGLRGPELIAWVDGAETVHPLDESGGPVYGGQNDASGITRGVIVGLAEPAWSHEGTLRFDYRDSPREFLEDLRKRALVRFDGIATGELDGRPALTVRLPATSNDIHPGDTSGGLAGSFVTLGQPSRFTLLEVEGRMVFVMTWARTDEELDEWLPLADEFVRSIHFVESS